MRKALLAVLVMSIVPLQIHEVAALDLSKVINNVAGHVINDAMRGGSSMPRHSPQPQVQYHQPQETKTYTYEEYMALQAQASQNENINESELPGEFTYEVEDTPADVLTAKREDNFDPDNPFAGLFVEEEPPAANAGGAQDGKSGDTIEVVATGIGQDSDQALKNALRAAVEQAVGTLVDSETLAKNDAVVNDQILSYSAGFVQSHKVIGEPRTSDGLVTIKILAQVKRTQLAEKLQAANIYIKEVDGESLFGEIFTKSEQEQDAIEIIKKKFEGFPENLLDIKMTGKPQYNHEQKKIQIDIEISINRDRYYKFANDLTDLLKKIALNNQSVNKSAQLTRDSIWFPYFYNVGYISICIQINDARTSGKFELFHMPSEIMKMLYRSIKRPNFIIEITGSSNEILLSSHYNAPVPYNIRRLAVGHELFILPLLDNSNSEQFITPGTSSGKWILEFDASAEEIKRMRNVICKIEKRQ